MQIFKDIYRSLILTETKQRIGDIWIQQKHDTPEDILTDNTCPQIQRDITSVDDNLHQNGNVIGAFHHHTGRYGRVSFQIQPHVLLLFNYKSIIMILFIITLSTTLTNQNSYTHWVRMLMAIQYYRQ